MNKAAQIATLKSIVADPTQTAYLRGRAAEIIRRYGLPEDQQRALALAEFTAYQEETAATLARSRALKAARDEATDPIVREALNEAINKNLSLTLTKLKKR